MKEYLQGLKDDFASSEVLQREAIETSMVQNRSLEIQFEGTQLDLKKKSVEVKVLQEILESKNQDIMKISKEKKKKFSAFGRGRRKTLGGSTTNSKLLRSLSRDGASATPILSPKHSIRTVPSQSENFTEQNIMNLQAQSSSLRTQFEILARSTKEDLQSLPQCAKGWVHQVTRALTSSQSEIQLLRSKLALESAQRRKLNHEIQDLRGTVRVFCRPRPAKKQSVISIPSYDTVVLHREKLPKHTKMVPLSFEFDQVFSEQSSQSEVYNEMEELCLGALDGYIVCVMAYGQTGAGKTHTLIGDTRGEVGVHLQAVNQLFTIADKRTLRYQDSFSMTILEVHGDRLADLVAGTKTATAVGEMQGGDIPNNNKKSRRRGRNRDSESGNQNSPKEEKSVGSKMNKLEIRTNYDGDTVVQGLLSIPVKNIEDVKRLWDECLTQRATRLAEHGVSLTEHEKTSHVITTVNVISTNIATGVGTVGKLQFVDLAGSDLLPRRTSSSSSKSSSTTKSHMDALLTGVGNNTEWRFANKSLATMCDVVNARCQFARSVPYRNSTLTHLLRDSFEGDAKVLLVCCISSDIDDIQETATALRFASRMRRLEIGRATKHTVSLA